jgi:rhodanese-related sulfurtransferase
MPTTARSVTDIVAEARGRVRNLTVAEVATALEDGELALVDLREADEIARTGTIPGAVHAPRGMLEFHADPTTPYHLDALHPDRRTILYCASGGRSALGVLALQDLGYADVAHLDGGVKAWEAAGRPLAPVH